jgi:hypothetical protein
MILISWQKQPEGRVHQIAAVVPPQFDCGARVTGPLKLRENRPPLDIDCLYMLFVNIMGSL